MGREELPQGWATITLSGTPQNTLTACGNCKERVVKLFEWFHSEPA